MEHVSVDLRILYRKLSDPLYRESFFLISSRALNVLCGFFFWIMAARLYSLEDVGVATTLNSSLTLVLLISRLGCDVSIIRFLPIYKKETVYNTCVTITTIASLVFGVIYIAISAFLPQSKYLINNHAYIVIFLLFSVMNSIAVMTGLAFITLREAENYFYQNIFLLLRVFLLIPLVFLGYMGVFGSIGLAFILASLFGFILLGKSLSFNFLIDKQFLKESFKFTSRNYIANLLSSAPILLLPIMVLNMLGEAEAAKYYLAYAIGSVLILIPDSISTSVFVEGCYGESLKTSTIKALKTICSLLIPGVLILYFAGGSLLNIVGKDYVDALGLLKLFAISSLFYTLCSLFTAIQNVRMKAESVVKFNIFRSILLMCLSYIGILKLGIIGVGWAWLITYIVVGSAIVVTAKREGWIKI